MGCTVNRSCDGCYDHTGLDGEYFGGASVWRLDHAGSPAILFFSTFFQDSIRRLPMNSTAANSSADQPNATRAEDFDILILGGGTGSTVAAWTFAKEGKRVAVADRKYIGGSCPNIAAE